MGPMRISPARWLVALACLALLLCGARTESAWAAKKKPAKSWPSKKKHPAHKRSAPASSGAKPAGAAPADEADEEGGDESAQGDDSAADTDKSEGAAKTKPKKVARGGEESGEGDGSEDEDGDSTVVRKKARKHEVADEGGEGAPIALELSAGPRAVHRTFNF